MTNQRRTYALYTRMHDGTWLRVGTFRASGTSVRDVSDSLMTRLPNLDPARTEIALIHGRKYEAARTPLDPAQR